MCRFCSFVYLYNSAIVLPWLSTCTLFCFTLLYSDVLYCTLPILFFNVLCSTWDDYPFSWRPDINIVKAYVSGGQWSSWFPQLPSQEEGLTALPLQFFFSALLQVRPDFGNCFLGHMGAPGITAYAPVRPLTSPCAIFISWFASSAVALTLVYSVSRKSKSLWTSCSWHLFEIDIKDLKNLRPLSSRAASAQTNYSAFL